MTLNNSRTITKKNVQSILSGFTIETTPFSANKIETFQNILKPNTTVYVTFLPGSDYEETIKVSKRLKEENFRPVPHFAARSILNANSLDDALSRLTGELGINEVLCIAGGNSKPIGAFSSSMELMETGLFNKHGIKRIGVAGHPEGSPDISDEGLASALKWKNQFHSRTDAELHIVTQFCFDTAKIIEWEKKIRVLGNTLPITIGIPGVASLKTLLKYAQACGIGQSINFIKKQAKNITKILQLSTPDKQIIEIANYKSSERLSRIQGVHIYPLGGLKKSADWVYKILEGNFSVNTKDNTFDLEE